MSPLVRIDMPPSTNLAERIRFGKRLGVEAELAEVATAASWAGREGEDATRGVGEDMVEVGNSVEATGKEGEG
jgi:hypothetical protein